MHAASRSKVNWAASARSKPGRPARRTASVRKGTLDASTAAHRPRRGRGLRQARTAVDALAIAIGTSHGAYKFTRQPTGDVLAIDRIKEIHARIPNTHLVMHGSSIGAAGMAGDHQQVRRRHRARPTACRCEEIVEGIKHGVRKVNIDTDLRMASTGAIRKTFAKDPSDFDPRKALIAAKKAVRGICKARFEAFGCAGHADRIKPIPLDAMAKRYH